MLKKLEIKNFTVFEDITVEFAPGLNVVIGENGTGKSHLLKLGYCVMKSSWEAGKEKKKASEAGLKPEMISYHDLFTKNLLNTFGAESIDNLGSKSNSGIHVVGSFDDTGYQFSYNKSLWESSGVTVRNNEKYMSVPPVFIPPKEVLTMYSWLPGLYGKYDFKLDQTYPDLTDLLQVPLLRSPDSTLIGNLVSVIQTTIGGKIIIKNNRFYLRLNNGTDREVELIAEGFRKLGLLSYIVLNGTLEIGNTLFWDEPESNLNPLILKKLAKILYELSELGFQIILATHSLFLMKEIHILSSESQHPVSYISLEKKQGKVSVQQVNDIGDLDVIPSLEAEIEQAPIFLNTP
ncbi:MAG: AAA family ATPase [Bacteroidota bacterium]